MISPARLATFAVNGSTKYGAVVDGGIVDLSARHAKDYPTLREVVAAGALMRLADEAARFSPYFALAAVSWHSHQSTGWGSGKNDLAIDPRAAEDRRCVGKCDRSAAGDGHFSQPSVGK